MAVQKSRKSRSKRGMRRAHDALTGATLSVSDRGVTHRRHHMASDGTYRGKQIVALKVEKVDSAAEEEAN